MLDGFAGVLLAITQGLRSKACSASRNPGGRLSESTLSAMLQIQRSE
jgi:hypothetical protein